MGRQQSKERERERERERDGGGILFKGAQNAATIRFN